MLLNFENRSYAVDIKYDPEIPVIKITYPESYVKSIHFPIYIIVETEDITATGKSLHSY